MTALRGLLFLLAIGFLGLAGVAWIGFNDGIGAAVCLALCVAAFWAGGRIGGDA